MKMSFVYIGGGVTRCEAGKTSGDTVEVVQQHGGLEENIRTGEHGEVGGPSNMRDGETDTSSYRQHWMGVIDRNVTAIRLQTAIATTLDSDLAFVTRTSLVVTLIERTCRGLGDVNVLEASEDAQPSRAVVVGKHCPQAMPAIALPELEHDAKVCLIPASLLRTSGIKRLVTHRNRSASVDGQVYICLTATLGENPV